MENGFLECNWNKRVYHNYISHLQLPSCRDLQELLGYVLGRGVNEKVSKDRELLGRYICINIYIYIYITSVTAVRNWRTPLYLRVIFYIAINEGIVVFIKAWLIYETGEDKMKQKPINTINLLKMDEEEWIIQHWYSLWDFGFVKDNVALGSHTSNLPWLPFFDLHTHVCLTDRLEMDRWN